MSDPSVRPAPLPASPPVEGPAKSSAYRPLSLLAVVGCGLAGLYAAAIVLGGLVAFFRGDPWLLAGWSALVPIAAALLSLLGLIQVQRSEGTLAGDRVARWGLLLSVLVGLGYFAYVFATQFAIGQEAEHFARGFLGKASDRDLLTCFRLALPPDERPADDDNLRAQAERRFNALGEPGSKGYLTTFWRSEPIRMIYMGGHDTKIESLGVEDLQYTGGAYEVKLLYRVTTPQLKFVLTMMLVGKEGRHSEGRQWYADWNRVGISDAGDSAISHLGQRWMPAGLLSRMRVSQGWLAAMREGKTEEVFYWTVPVPQREPLRKSAEAARVALVTAAAFRAGALPGGQPALLAAVAQVADTRLGSAASLPGLDAMLAGGLVLAEKDEFWAPDDVREPLARAVRQEFFHPGEMLGNALTPDSKVRIPLLRKDGDRLVIEHDVTLNVPLAAPRYQVDARIVMDCDLAEAEAGAESVQGWHIIAVRLISGRPLPVHAPPAAGAARPAN